MATPDKVYKAYYRRQHRVLGAYLATHCWHNGYDAVIVDRSTLAHIHELTNFTKTHLSWLQRDIKPYFAHSFELYHSKGAKNFAAVALSRVPIPKGFGDASLDDTKRAAFWRKKDFRVAALSEMPTCESVFTEKEASSFLALISVGLVVPKDASRPEKVLFPKIKRLV